MYIMILIGQERTDTILKHFQRMVNIGSSNRKVYSNTDPKISPSAFVLRLFNINLLKVIIKTTPILPNYQISTKSIKCCNNNCNKDKGYRELNQGVCGYPISFIITRLSSGLKSTM